MQSDLGSTFREIREVVKTRPVLFSGTPCQVDGLYRFLGERPENLTTCDLVCGGVPSPGVWESLVADRARRKRKAVVSVRFCSKVAGWQNCHLTLRYEDGSQDSAPLYETEYGRAFGRSLFLRESCFRCPYSSLSRVGDVKDAKDNISGLIEDTWNEFTGENNNLLLMDATAEAESLTDSRNGAPQSVQVLIRTQEIKETEAEQPEREQPETESLTLWQRIGKLFQSIGSAIAGIFGK